MFEKLPDLCFTINETTGKVVIVKKGVSGYFEYDNVKKLSIDELNDSIGVSKAEAAAMKTGSMFGWNVSGANPDNYDSNGKFISK